MAKLSAHGKELARVAKENPVTDSGVIVWERTTVVLMSDGKLLKKRDVQFKPLLHENGIGQKHCYGWKAYGKVKPEVTAEVFFDAYLSAGYIKET